MESTEIFGSKEGEQPMSCGLFTATQGHTTGFKYPCAEFTIVLEGMHHRYQILRTDNDPFRGT